MDEPRPLQHNSPPSATTNLPPSPAIQKIDQHIAHHNRIIVDKSVQDNSHQPISKLPVEVLCRIFALAQDLFGQHESCRATLMDLTSDPSLWWLVLTHVSQYWRNAALNEPSLWTRPPLHYKKWTSVFLERSRMAGLTLSFCCERLSMDSESIATVLSHIPRATTLVLRNTSRFTLAQMCDHIMSTDIAAPMLETLAIGPRYYQSFSFPRTALRGAKLRHLTLKSLGMAWNSHLLSGLTDLTLANIPPSARPTPTELLFVLEQNPALRNLTLEYAFPPEDSLELAPPYANRRVFLRSLETFHIHLEVPAYEFVYNHITLSDSMKKISAKFDNDGHSNRNVRDLLSALHKAYIGPPLGRLPSSAYIGDVIVYDKRFYPFYEFVFATSGTVDATLFGFDDSDSIHLINNNNNDALELQLIGRNSSREFTFTRISEVSDFFHGLRWDNLSLLDISFLRLNEPRLDTLLATTFGMLPGLRAVAVGESTANPLINALVFHADKDPALYPDSITFPALRYLNLTHVEFAADASNCDPSAHAVHMDALLDCLMDRYERGVEIHSLAIMRCHVFHKRRCDLLREVVPAVNWDGYSDYDDFTSEDAELRRHLRHMKHGRIPQGVPPVWV